MRFAATTLSVLSLLAFSSAQETSTETDLVTSIASAETSLATVPLNVTSTLFGPVAGNATASGVAGSGTAGTGVATVTSTGSGSGSTSTGGSDSSSSASGTSGGDASATESSGASESSGLAPAIGGPQVVMGAVAGFVGVLGVLAL